MKLTKDQLKAIGYLRCGIGELDNKPRRVFRALERFAKAFIRDDEALKGSLDRIDEFERFYYKMLSIPEILEECGRAKLCVDRELLSRMQNPHHVNRDEASYYKEGVEDATTKYAKIMSNFLIDNIR